jgi:putative Mn2+ efflux pump MntP
MMFMYLFVCPLQAGEMGWVGGYETVYQIEWVYTVILFLLLIYTGIYMILKLFKSDHLYQRK